MCIYLVPNYIVVIYAFNWPFLKCISPFFKVWPGAQPFIRKRVFIHIVAKETIEFRSIVMLRWFFYSRLTGFTTLKVSSPSYQSLVIYKAI